MKAKRKTKKAVSKVRRVRGRAVRHARKMSALRGAVVKSKKRKVPKHKHKAKIVLLGTSSFCKDAAQSERDQNSLFGKRKGAIMPKKSSVKSWFRKGRKSRRGRRMSGELLGVPGMKGIAGQLQNSAMVVAGAGVGSFVGARIPLPANLAKFRGLVPIVAGVALGASKFGRKGIGANIALGMMVAGGLALGRQYAPQFFAGEDELLGLPMLEGTENLGLPFQGSEDEEDSENLGLEYQSGEDVEDVELFGEFATGADL